VNIKTPNPYLTDTRRSRVVGKRTGFAKKTRHKFFASPKIEHAALFAEFGLAIHLLDMVAVTGMSTKRWSMEYGGQRNALKEIVGEDFLAYWEGIMVSTIRARLKEFLETEKVPDVWRDTWETIKTHGHEIEPHGRSWGALKPTYQIDKQGKAIHATEETAKTSRAK
jgi:hypothetical protein